MNCFLCVFTLVSDIPPMQAAVNFMLNLLILAYELVHSGLEQTRLLQDEAATQTSDLGPDFDDVEVV